MALARLKLRDKLGAHFITTRLDRRPDRHPQLVNGNALGSQLFHRIGDDPPLQTLPAAMHGGNRITTVCGDKNGQAVSGDHCNWRRRVREHAVCLNGIGHLFRLPFDHRSTVHLLADEHPVRPQWIIDRTKTVVDAGDGAEIVCLLQGALSAQ